MLATQLHERGVRIWVDGDKLKVQADPPLTDDLRQLIRINKQALIVELTPLALRVRAWRVLVSIPDGDDRPARWITMICTGDRDQARRAAEGTFTAARVIDVREANQ